MIDIYDLAYGLFNGETLGMLTHMLKYLLHTTTHYYKFPYLSIRKLTLFDLHSGVTLDLYDLIMKIDFNSDLLKR